MGDERVVVCGLCGCRKVVKVFEDGHSGIYRCSGCTLVFRYPQPDRAEIQEMYDTEGYLNSRYFDELKSDYNESNPAITLYNRGLEKVEQLVRPGKVLDVGCAYGVFLDIAQKRGWEAFGVEVSGKSATYAQQTFGLPVFAGTLEEAAFPDGNFRLVTLWDVIEHLSDPVGTLREVRRIMEDQGLILILTINVSSLIGRLANLSAKTKGFLYYSPHTYFFSGATLALMLEKAGFRDVRVVDSSGAQISRWQAIPIPKVFEWGLNFLDLVAKPIKSEYRQIVIGRK